MPTYHVWFGPFVLNTASLKTKIGSDDPGVILLGTMDAQGSFHIKQVTGSNNVRKDLRRLIGVWDVFMYELVQNEIQAVIDQHAISEYFALGKTSVSDPQGKRILDEFKEGFGTRHSLNLEQ